MAENVNHKRKEIIRREAKAKAKAEAQGGKSVGVHRFARISSTKARPIARLIQGMTVDKALDVLQFSPRRSAKMVQKVLRSAVANAGAGADLAGYVVASVRIDGGPIAVGTKRFIPVSRGMAHPIKKRTSHIIVTVEQIKAEEEQ